LITYTTGGTLTITGCWIGLADAFTAWDKENRGWNGTFIDLRSGSFKLTNTEFENILINGDNSFISAIVEAGETLTIDGCAFVSCGRLDGSVSNYGAPISVELKEDETTPNKLKIKDITFENCISAAESVQVVYMKGNYNQYYSFDSISLNYESEPSDPLVFLEITDLPDRQTIINDENFRGKFPNLCDVINEKNFLIKNSPKNYSLYELICACESITTIETCSIPYTVSTTKCIWVSTAKEVPFCQPVQPSCDEITDEDVCEFPGAAVDEKEDDLDCLWLDGDTNTDTKGECVLEVYHKMSIII
jgi:hypothetical protein